MLTFIKDKKVTAHNIETTVTMLRQENLLYTVTVVYRFASGNYLTEKIENLSEVAAEGLLAFHTQ